MACDADDCIEGLNAIKNWHQTILSRDECFHLYPAPDADGWIEWNGGECPVGENDLIDVKFSDGDTLFGVDGAWDWSDDADGCNIIAYRLHKPEQSGAADKLSSDAVSAAKIALMSDSIEELVRKPTIEQLAADYRNAKDYAERKQEEADDAKEDADEALRNLELAGEAIGLVVTPIAEKKEPELVREVKVGDEVECVEPNVFREKYRGMIGRLSLIDESDTSTPYLVDLGGNAKIWCHEVKFIRRP